MASITFTLVQEACKKRNLKLHLLIGGTLEQNAPFYYILDRSGQKRYARGVVSDKTSAAAMRIAKDKLATAAVAKLAGIPTPATEEFTTYARALDFLHTWKTIVVKPLDASHGNGITTNITQADQLHAAVERAQQSSPTVLLQQQINGRDARLLYIGTKFCAAAQRTAATVTGDGASTIRELIEQTNKSPERGNNYTTKYNYIPIDAAELFLGERLDGEIPAKGQEVTVVGTTNIGSGGMATDITDSIPASVIDYANRLVQELTPGVYGIDFLINDSGAWLLEINTSPSFGLHHHPHKGQPRDVAGAYIDWLVSETN